LNLSLVHDEQHPLPDPVKDLLAYWDGARETEFLPSSEAIDPLKLRKWISDIALIEYTSGEKNLFIRLHGNNVARNVGNYDARGYLEDVVPASAHSVVFEPFFVARRLRRPVYSVLSPAVLEGSFRKFERLVLPFIDSKTREVDRFVVWIGPTGRDVLDCETIYEEPISGARKPVQIDGETELRVL